MCGVREGVGVVEVREGGRGLGVGGEVAKSPPIFEKLWEMNENVALHPVHLSAQDAETQLPPLHRSRNFKSILLSQDETQNFGNFACATF